MTKLVTRHFCSLKFLSLLPNQWCLILILSRRVNCNVVINIKTDLSTFLHVCENVLKLGLLVHHSIYF